MKPVNEWTHNFSQQIDGLDYTNPFSVGDYVVAHFNDVTDEIQTLSERYVMKVIQIGVPIKVKTHSYHIDTFGDLVDDGFTSGNTVEGVRVQLLFHKDGVYEDAGHGYKENLPVSMLRQVDPPVNRITETVSPKLDNESLRLFEKAKYESKRKKYGWD